MPVQRSRFSNFIVAIVLTPAILLLGFAVWLLASDVVSDILQSWGQVEPKDKPQIGINLLQTIATIAGGIAIFWNIALTRRQLSRAQEQQITDRFSKAVEQLGHEKRAVQIGAIYALERIAQDSPRDYWTIMEVLSAFVRDRRALPPGVFLAANPVSFDRAIQSAIVVLGRRDVENRQDQRPIYLSYTDLRQVAFFKGNFDRFRFMRSDLRDVNFSKCSLREARFWEACLTKADFCESDLTNAVLAAANLREANLTDAILQGADLEQTNLENVQGLTVKQVKSAKNWQEAIYDSEFQRLLGLGRSQTT